MRYKKTEVCQTCSKLKNICQTCLFDLEYGRFICYYFWRCLLLLYARRAFCLQSLYCIQVLRCIITCVLSTSLFCYLLRLHGLPCCAVASGFAACLSWTCLHGLHCALLNLYACVRACMRDACVCMVQWFVQSIFNRNIAGSIPVEYGLTCLFLLFYLWVVTNSQMCMSEYVVEKINK